MLILTTFQIEQLEQKAEKRHRTKEYRIISDFSGSWFPFWSQGCRIALHPPCTDEPRITIRTGDTVKVTRWKK
jgi:palmitoyltransferase